MAQEVDLSRPLTVDECVRVALGESPVIGMAEADLQRADGAALATLRALLPTVTGDAGWSRQTTKGLALYMDPSGGLTTEETNYYGSLGLDARQSLLDLSSIEEVRSSRSLQRAAQFDLSAAHSAVKQDVSSSFYGCVAAILLAGVEDDAVAVAREQLRRAETLFNLGSVARSDVLQAKVNLADAELNAINRHNAVRVESSRLGTKMGLDPRTDLQVDTTLAIPAVDPQGATEEWIDVALERRPDLEAARQRLRAAERAEAGAKLAYLPTLGASANWSRNASTSQDWLFRSDECPVDTLGRAMPCVRRTTNWGVGVGFSLTLFDGFGREGSIQSATAQRRSARESLEQLQQAVALEVKDAFLSIAKERESLRAARESVQLAAESLRLQQALYESGAGTMLEWDNARLGLRRARVSLIQAEISLLLAHLRFHTAIGE